MSIPTIDDALKAAVPARRSEADWMAGVRRKRTSGRAATAIATTAVVAALGVAAVTLLPGREAVPPPAAPQAKCGSLDWPEKTDRERSVLVSHATLDGWTAMLLRDGETLVLCGVSPDGRGGAIVPVEVTQPGSLLDPWAGYEMTAFARIWEEGVLHQFGAGDLPPGAESVEFPDATASEVTLGNDGAYTYVVQTVTERPEAVQDQRYVVRDGSGAILGEGVIAGPDAPQR